MSKITFRPGSPKVVYASEIGCTLNTDLSTGGGTDDTARLNQFLALASPTNPIKLIIDGCALISGLVIPALGHVTIEGLGHNTGFYNVSGNGNIIISNGYPPTTGVATPPAVSGQNVIFRNFYLNGNSAGNRNNLVSYGIQIQNVYRVELDNVFITNCAQFCTRFDNCYEVIVTKSIFESGNELEDGVHVCGPCQQVTVSDCYFATGDDSIALNCPEGFGGDIVDVAITNNRFNSYSGVRSYTSNKQATFRIKRLAISNCVGKVQTNAFNFGIEENSSSGTDNQIEDCVISNCDFEAGAVNGTHWLQQNTPFGTMSVSNCIWRSPTQAESMINSGWSGGDLILNNLSIVRNDDGNAAAWVADIAGTPNGTKRVTLNGIRLCDQRGPATTYPTPGYMVNVFGSGLGVLRVTDVDVTGFTSFLGSGALANIGKFAGDGLMATGQVLSSAQVQNGSMYLNANGGASVNINGVEKNVW